MSRSEVEEARQYIAYVRLDDADDIDTNLIAHIEALVGVVEGLEAQLQELREALDAEIARMEEAYDKHSRRDDYARIVQADAHLNGLKFARDLLAPERTA